MPSLTLDDRLIWFAHCPKAGGTSVERLMVDTFGGAAVAHLHWGWDLWWKHGGWRRADPPNSPQHLIWEDALAVLPRAPDRVFALVRDPATRLQSEQRWQRRGRRGTRAGRLFAALPFSLWLRLGLAMAARNPHVFDNHLRLQSDFVPDHAQIFRLEQGLTPLADWLSQETGQPVSGVPPHLLSSGQSGELHPADAALIARTFARDYRRFDYVAPADQTPARPGLDWLVRALAAVLIWAERRALL